jgi:membrane protein required for colicin V production
MNGLDWVVVAVLALSTLAGCMRGLVRTLFGLAGWVAAVVLALRFGDVLGDVVLSSIRNPALRTGVAMIVLFLVVMMVTVLTGALLARIIRAVGLGFGDRLLGGVFGAVRGFVFVLVAAVVAGFTSLPQSVLWRTSFFGPRLEALALQIKPWLPESLAAFVHFGTEI